jgi:hypothetical protein
MRKRSLLALLAIATFAAAVAAGLGTSVAFAGEVTGNCNHAKSSKAKENCRETPIGAPSDEDPPHASSICSFSGQNDGEAPEGRNAAHVQSWGQIPKAVRDAIAEDSHPGVACNGHTGFFSGG